MKALLLAVNSKHIHTALSPWYLKAAVRNWNLTQKEAELLPEPEILETNINRPVEETLEQIRNYKPDFLGICCYIWNMNYVAQVLELLKGSLPQCRIVLGGPEVSFNGKERLEELTNVDYIICGEGEGSYLQLLQYESGYRLGSQSESQPDGRVSLHYLGCISGLVWRQSQRDIEGDNASKRKNSGDVLSGATRRNSGDGLSGANCLNSDDSAGAGANRKVSANAAASGNVTAIANAAIANVIVVNPVEEVLSFPPNPYLPEFLAAVNGRIVYVETTRGCPFSCSFCLSGRRGNVRYFDLDEAKKQILLLANCGTKTVKFVDRTFNCHPKRSREIVSFILEKYQRGEIPQGICFHFEVAADLFDQGGIELLQGAPLGLFQLEVGLQSFNLDTLMAINRKTNLEKIKANFESLRKNNNIHLHLDLIAGLPYEDYSSFKSSFNQGFALRPHMLQLGFLKLLHGSQIRKEKEKFEMIFEAEPPYTVQQTKWLSQEEMSKLALCEDALERLYNSGRFPDTLEYLLKNSLLAPFDLFSQIGSYIGTSIGMPLEKYIAKLLDYGVKELGLPFDGLRNALVVDWLKTNHVGVLPKVLQIADPLMKKISKALEAIYQNGEPLPHMGTRRHYGFGLLYEEGAIKVALADYRRPRPELGNYPLEIIDYAKVLTWANKSEV